MNCIIVDDDKMIRQDLKTKIRQTMMLHLVGSYESAEEASGPIMDKSPDIIFLDVLMPGMTGMEFIKTLDVLRPEVILITSNKEFAAEAFDYGVTDFLVKPFSYERFLKAVTKAKYNIDKKGTTIKPWDDHIFIKVAGRHIKLDFKSITYIEALADYITIHATSGKYTIHSTMKGIEKVLPETDFLRVHNSFIIRLDKIVTVENGNITINKTIIPVSRNKHKELIKRLTLK